MEPGFNLDAIILAAGAGTRMRSKLPKVLHKLAGRTLIAHVIERAALLTDRLHLVTGAGREEVEASVLADFAGLNLHFHAQEARLGTGHAVQQAIHACQPGGRTLVLYGDVPLVDAELLQQLAKSRAPLVLLTTRVKDPTGYGRILRGPKGVEAIVEQSNATPGQLAINEIHTGVLSAETDRLRVWLNALARDPVQQEYLLTDIVAMAVREKAEVQALLAEDPLQVQGINTREQLAALEACLQQAEAMNPEQKRANS